MASSRKPKNHAPPTAATNRPRDDTYSTDRPGNGAWKGRGSYNVDDQKTGRWVNPSSDRDQGNKQRGWKELGKPQLRNVNLENRTTTARNVGGWGQYGKEYQVTQESWRPNSSKSAHRKIGRSDLAVLAPLANGWKWGDTKLNSSVASPPPGKSAGHSSAKAT